MASEPMRRKQFSQIGWGIFALSLVSNGAQILAQLWAARYAPQLAGAEWFYWLLSTAPLHVLGLGALLLVTHRVPIHPFSARQDLPLGKVAALGCMTLACSMAGGWISLLGNGAVGLLRGRPVYNPAGELQDRGIFATVLVVAIIGPLMEEVIFRRVLLGKLLNWGQPAAIWGSALLFALIHRNSYQFFTPFLVGLLLAYVAVRTGTILYSVLLHMLNNFVSCCAMFLQGREPMMIVAFSMAILLVTAAGLALLGLLLARIQLERGREDGLERGWLRDFLGNPGIVVCVLLHLGIIAYFLLI